MNCLICAQRGSQETAVAVCSNCGVALCMEHFAERQQHRVGGMPYGCPHNFTSTRRTEQESSQPSILSKGGENG